MASEALFDGIMRKHVKNRLSLYGAHTQAVLASRLGTTKEGIVKFGGKELYKALFKPRPAGGYVGSAENFLFNVFYDGYREGGVGGKEALRAICKAAALYGTPVEGLCALIEAKDPCALLKDPMDAADKTAFYVKRCKDIEGFISQYMADGYEMPAFEFGGETYPEWAVGFFYRQICYDILKKWFNENENEDETD